MFELIYSPTAWASLFTLTMLEIVLGIDNVVFISVILQKLPKNTAERARKFGLFAALVFRILLLIVLSWVIKLTTPVFEIFDTPISWRDLILILGGLFLIYKSSSEIHDEIEGESEEEKAKRQASQNFLLIIGQIVLIDMVFSIDSIVTALGMAEHVEIMILAVIIAMAVMYIASGVVANFIREHPTTKMLALSFLLLIGVALIADGLGFHIPRAYLYFAMAFSAAVEVVNILRGKKRTKPKN